MDSMFLKKYKDYDKLDVNELKHIPEISFYNHNYYIGLKRNNKVCHDIIYEECNELAGFYEYFHIEGDVSTYIGYRSEDENFITIESEQFT